MKTIRSTRNAAINELGGTKVRSKTEAVAAKAPPPARPAAPPPGGRPKRQYRRGPFYLKIEGLTGPRPKYDEFGRPAMADFAD